MDFPSGMNSFRRMVVYRIADRFGLQAEQINLDVSMFTGECGSPF